VAGLPKLAGGFLETKVKLNWLVKLKEDAGRRIPWTFGRI